MLAIIAKLQPEEIPKQVGTLMDILFYKGAKFPSNEEILKEEITFVLFKYGNNLKIVDGGFTLQDRKLGGKMEESTLC